MYVRTYIYIYSRWNVGKVRSWSEGQLDILSEVSMSGFAGLVRTSPRAHLYNTWYGIDEGVGWEGEGEER